MSYTPASGTDTQKLTLNNANITGSCKYDGNKSAAIYTSEELDLVLIGSNTAADSNPNGVLHSRGIGVSGILTVSGTGSINAVSDTSATYGIGVWSYYGFTLNSGMVRAYGSAYGVAANTKVYGGTLIASSDGQASQVAPSTTGYTGCTVTASTSKTGTPEAAYAAGNIATYKYVRVGLPATTYNVWVGATQVTSDNAGDVLGDGTVSYTPASGTDVQKLTLNNANITVGGAHSPSIFAIIASIYAGTDLELELIGSNTINNSQQSTVGDNDGIAVNGTLTVSGTGSLNVTAGAAKDTSFFSIGIWCFAGALIINSGTVTAYGERIGASFTSLYVHGGTLIASSDGWASAAAPSTTGYTGWAVTVSTSKDGSSPVTYPGDDMRSYKYMRVGLPAITYNVWVGATQVTAANAANVLGDVATPTVVYTPASGTDAQKLTLNNANITGGGEHDTGTFKANTSAIYAGANPDLELIGSNTVSNAAQANANNCGIAVMGDSTISGTGSLIVTAGAAKDASHTSLGIWCFGGALTVNSGTVTAYGERMGISSASLNVSGGTLVTSGDTQASVMAPTTTGYTGCAITASTSKTGTPAVAYNAGDISTYQYLKVAPITYDVWVGTTQVTAANAANVLGDVATPTVVYTPASGTVAQKLTLNNANIAGCSEHDTDKMTASIYAGAKLDLELIGSNIVSNAAKTTADNNLGIAVMGNSTISGTGSLTVSAGAAKDASHTSIGIWCKGGILTVKSGTVTATGQTYGISAWIDFNGGTVVATGDANALTTAPDTDRYTGGCTITVSEDKTGTPAVTYRAVNITTYKYFKIAPAAKYNVWVAGRQVTEANAANVLGDVATPTVVYTPASGTDAQKLTLNNAAVRGSYTGSYFSCGIYAEGDLDLVCSGTNSISNTNVGQRNPGTAVRTTGDLNVTLAAGSVTTLNPCERGGTSGNTGVGLSVADEGNLAISGTGTLKILPIGSAFSETAGISVSNGNCTITDSTIIIETEDGSGNYYGIRVYNDMLTLRNADVTIKNGNSAGYEKSNVGIRCTKLVMDGGTLDVTAGTGSLQSVGIFSTSYDIAVISGTVKVSGMNKAVTGNPNLASYTDLKTVYVGSTSPSGPWDGTTEMKTYKYVAIEPAAPATFTDISANGSATSSTTELTLTFTEAVPGGLTAADVTVTGATKGALVLATGTNIYKLAITNITVADGANVTVSLAKRGTVFAPASKTVTVHKYTPPVTFNVTFDLAGGTHTGGGALLQVVNSGDSAVAPTVRKDGYTFVGWDKSLTNITGEQTITAMWNRNNVGFTYSITGGVNQTIYNMSKGAAFQTTIDYSNVSGVMVDGIQIASKYYTLSSGNTAVTLKGSYLATLAKGTHTLGVQAKDGSVASTTFTISPTATSAKTFDSTQLPLYYAVLGSSALALAVLVILKKRKERMA